MNEASIASLSLALDYLRMARAYVLSAVILALCRDRSGSAPFPPAWCAEHLPLMDAATNLLEADNAQFAGAARPCATFLAERRSTS